MRLETGELKDFEKYNQEYYAGEYRGSEARPYDLEKIKEFLKIRSEYKYVDQYVPGKWRKVQIVLSCSKYGSNYIYFEDEQKLWRTRQTIEEYYGGGVVD